MPRKAYDVVIIGAGSVGIPAAWSMAREGLRVLVLDRFASPGQGSNKSAIGGIRATHSDPAKIRLALRTIEIASKWEETYGESIEWTTGGYSFVAFGEREERILKDLLVVQQRHALNIDWHDGDDLLETIPSLNREGLRGGTFSPEDGHCSTLLFGHAMYERAKREGACFHFREPVTAIPTKGGRVSAVVTDRGRYETRFVVNAGGAWASEIGRLVGLQHPVQPDSHEGGITEPVAPFLGPMIVDIRPSATAANCYFFQLATGQLVFSLTPRPIIPGFDCRETSTFLPTIARRMISLVPRLAGLRVRRTWRGLYPMSPDGSPLVGRSNDVEGYLMAIGLCGQGFMLGPGLGDLLSRMVRDKLGPEDVAILDQLSPHREFEGQEALK